MEHVCLDRRAALATAMALLYGGPARAADPGVSPGELLIGQNITLQGGKNRYGTEVRAGIKTLLDGVNAAGGVFGRRIVLKTLDDENQPAKAEANVRLAAQEKGVEVGAALPFKSDTTDAQLDAMVAELAAQKVDMVLNHGSAVVYERLVRKARAAGSRATFLAVNSGSTQLAESLGPLAQGMVFSQVVPSPWSRKTAIAREYQDAFTRANPGHGFSYGSLEGYLTAKALVLALRLAGPQPSRAGLAKALDGATLELGGLRARYRSGDHAGSDYVDLVMVTREGRFLQ